jgi:hypothetical protein
MWLLVPKIMRTTSVFQQFITHYVCTFATPMLGEMQSNDAMCSHEDLFVLQDCASCPMNL